jgi:AcrR family transcriptional regulator
MESEPRPDSLRDRKRLRARESIRRAALELFAERGFDEVTVTDIAERAEVGRTTFFRYFGDKQEVLFSDDEEEVAAVAAETPAPPKPIGSSLRDALRATRAIVVTFVERITADAVAYERHQRLVNEHPELYARSLLKQRHHADALTARLVAWGADSSTARVAAEVGLACFFAGQAEAADDPRMLPQCVAQAFGRLGRAASR